MLWLLKISNRDCFNPFGDADSPDSYSFLLTNIYLIINNNIMLDQTERPFRTYELGEIKRNSSVEPSLQKLDEKTAKNVLRLLNEGTEETKKHKTRVTGLFCLDPLSRKCALWNFLFLFWFYATQIQISLLLAFEAQFFQQELSDMSFTVLYSLSLLFFLVDIILNFHKGYYAFGKGKVIFDAKVIVLHYLKKQFILDLASLGLLTVPLVGSTGLNFLQMVPLLLLWYKKYIYQEQITKILQYHKKTRTIFIIVVLFLDVLLFGHYGACIFVGMDIYLYNEQYYGSNPAYYWLAANSFLDSPWYVQYINAQSFSTGTLSTLAPGPFGKNPLQILYSIFLMTFFMVLASYVGQILISLLYTTKQKRVFHQYFIFQCRSNIQCFDKFMQLKGVAGKVKDRIYNFFELIWQVEVKMQTEEQEAVINKLPLHLKEQLLIQMSFTKEFEILKYLPNKKQMEKMLALKIQRVVVDSYTCLFNQDLNSDEKRVYFLKEGMIKLYMEMKIGEQKKVEKIFSLSNLERLLGAYEFIVGCRHLYCCKTIDLSSIDYLSHSDFMEVIFALKAEEEYNALRDRIMVEHELKLINRVCLVCLGHHLQRDCPQVFVGQSIRLQFSENQPTQQRKKFSRKDYKIGRLISSKGFEKSSQNPFIELALFRDKDFVYALANILRDDELESVYKYRAYFPMHNI